MFLDSFESWHQKKTFKINECLFILIISAFWYYFYSVNISIVIKFQWYELEFIAFKQ